MIELKPTRMIGRTRDGSFQAAGYVYDEQTDAENDVIITFDYSAAQADRPNADLPNPGPGHDAEVDVLRVSYDSDQNEQIDVANCNYDPAEFVELASDYTRERSSQDVSWARRVAGL